MSAVVFIPLTQGKVAVIDFEDFDKVRDQKRYANRKNNTWYALRKEMGKSVYLHRTIFPNGATLDIDHKDGDGLNNRKENLRYVTPSQNAQSFCKKRKGASSKYRGVSWHKQHSKWRAVIWAGRKHYHLGLFLNEGDAARAYDEKAKELFGEFASPNFP